MAQITTTLPFVDMPVAADGETDFIIKANALPPQFQALTDDSADFATEANALRDEVNGFQLSASDSAGAAANSASSASDSKDYIDQVIGTLQTDIVINDTTPSYTEVFSSQTTLDNINALIDDDSSVTDKTLSSSQIDMRIATASAAAGTALEATAKGALANGDLVSLLPDGRVEVTRNDASSVGTANQYDAGQSTYTSVVKLTETLIVVCFVDTTNSNAGTAVAGTVSGKTITFGPQVVFESGISASPVLSARRISDTDFIVCYRTGATYFDVIAGAISGTTITFGTALEVQGSRCEAGDIVVYSATEAIAFYQDYSSSRVGRYYAIDIAGTSLSLNSSGEQTFSTNFIGYISADTDGVSVFVAYNDGSSGGGHCKGATFSSGLLTLGTEETLFSTDAGYGFSAKFLNSNTVLSIYKKTGSGPTFANALSLSGITVTAGAEQQITATSLSSLSTSNLSKISDGVGIFVFQGIYAVKIEASENSLSLGSTVQVISNASVYSAVAGVNDEQVIVAAPNGSTNANAYVYTPPYDNTSGWIGFSKGDFSDTEQAYSHVLGGIADNQSGLTVNSRYYLDTATATLTTTDTGVEVGKAVASDKILVTGSGA